MLVSRYGVATLSRAATAATLRRRVKCTVDSVFGGCIIDRPWPVTVANAQTGVRSFGIQIVQRKIRGSDFKKVAEDAREEPEPTTAFRSPAPALPELQQQYNTVTRNNNTANTKRDGTRDDIVLAYTLWNTSASVIRETRATSRRAVALLKSPPGDFLRDNNTAALYTQAVKQISQCVDLVLNERDMLDRAVQQFDALCEMVGRQVALHQNSRVSLPLSSPLLSSSLHSTPPFSSPLPAALTQQSAQMYGHLFAVALDLLRATLNNAASADKVLQVCKRVVEEGARMSAARSAVQIKSAGTEAESLLLEVKHGLFAAGGAKGVLSALSELSNQSSHLCDKLCISLGAIIQRGSLLRTEEESFGLLEPVTVGMEEVPPAVVDVLQCTAQFMDFFKKALVCNYDGCVVLLRSMAHSSWLWGNAEGGAQLHQALGTWRAAAQINFHMLDRASYAWNSVILRARQLNELDTAIELHRASQQHANTLAHNLMAVLDMQHVASSSRAALNTHASSSVGIPLEYVEIQDSSATMHGCVPPQILRTAASAAPSHVAGPRLFARLQHYKCLSEADKRLLKRLCKRSSSLLPLLYPIRNLDQRGSAPAQPPSSKIGSDYSPVAAPMTIEGLPPIGDTGESHNPWMTDSSDFEDGHMLGTTDGGGVWPDMFTMDPTIHFFANPVDGHLRFLRQQFKRTPSPITIQSSPTDGALQQYVRYVEDVVTQVVRGGLHLNRSIGPMMLGLYLESDRKTHVQVNTLDSPARAMRPHPAVRLQLTALDPASRPFLRAAAMWLLRLQDIGGMLPDSRMISYLLVECTARATSRLPGELPAWCSPPATGRRDAWRETMPTSPHQLQAIIDCFSRIQPADTTAIQVIAALKQQVMRGSAGTFNVVWMRDSLDALLAQLPRPSAHNGEIIIISLLYFHLRADDALRALHIASMTLQAVANGEANDRLVQKTQHYVETTSASILQLLQNMTSANLIPSDISDALHSILLDRLSEALHMES